MGGGTRTNRPSPMLRRLFHGINLLAQRQTLRYPHLTPFVPAFLVVRWPSQSWPTSDGYKEIRDRTMQLTESGDAEFFLASLLGYLDQKNQRLGGTAARRSRLREDFTCIASAIRSAGDF